MFICRVCDAVYDNSIFCMTQEDWDQWNKTWDRYIEQKMCDKCFESHNIVNSIKLTKMEQKIMVFLNKPNNYKWHAKIFETGKNVSLLSDHLQLGNKEYGSMSNSAKASLSRSLKGLMKKEMVYKCKPFMDSYWDKKRKHMHRGIESMALYGYVKGRDNEQFIKDIRLAFTYDGDYTYGHFPITEWTTKNWYILTDRGKEMADSLEQIKRVK